MKPPAPWTRWLWGRSPRRTALRALALAGLTWIVLRYVCPVVRVEGQSMEPTLTDGSLHLANLLRYRWREPRRGEIVVIRMTGAHAMFAKRVIGTPGEEVAFHSGRLRVNGEFVPEPYVSFGGDWDMPPIRLGPGEYFVAGDNRAMPLANHALGTVRRERIVGGLLW